MYYNKWHNHIYFFAIVYTTETTTFYKSDCASKGLGYSVVFKATDYRT